MFDYRMFFASSTMEVVERDGRPLLGHPEKRVYRLPGDCRPERSRARR